MPSVFRGSDNFDTAGGNAVKAWVNFNGTGTVAIRASFNVSSITDNGTGDYTVNFTTALADANFAPLVTLGRGSRVIPHHDQVLSLTTSGYRFTIADTTNSAVVGVGFMDSANIFLAIFR